MEFSIASLSQSSLTPFFLKQKCPAGQTQIQLENKIRHLSDTSRIPLGHLSEISRKPLGDLSETSRTPLGNLSDTSRKPLGHLSDFAPTYVIHIESLHISSILFLNLDVGVCFREVSERFPRGFREVSERFPRCCRVVSEMFPRGVNLQVTSGFSIISLMYAEISCKSNLRLVYNSYINLLRWRSCSAATQTRLQCPKQRTQ